MSERYEKRSLRARHASMSRVLDNEKIDFLLAVFAEVNEHIRATDDKQILVSGLYITLVSVVMALVVDKTVPSWNLLALSLLMLVIGLLVVMLQLWYKLWKKHYLEICFNIASNFGLDEKFLPIFLKRREIKRKISSANLLILITLLIDIAIFIYSFYVLWILLECSTTIKIMINGSYLILYISVLIIGFLKLARGKL